MVILFFALLGLWTWKEQSDYEKTAVPYLKSVIPEMATWNSDVAWEHLAEGIRDQTNRDDHAKIIRYLSSLGALENLGRPQFRQVTSSASVRNGTQKLVFYQVPAVFEKGEASIDVTLLDEDGQFSIYAFHVRSMAFAEHQNGQSNEPETQDDTPE